VKSRKTHPRKIMDLLLERGRAIPAVPASVRARTLARARSEIGTIAKKPVAKVSSGRHRGVAFALAAAVAFGVGAAVATVGLRGATSNESVATPPPPPRAVQPSCATPTFVPPPSFSAAPQPSASPKPPLRAPSASAQESYAAELSVLQRAQAAYRNQDFATALRLAAEHRRRFPNGRLAQEREALRVKALKGAGREKEASQAAATFEAEYPRSPLLR